MRALILIAIAFSADVFAQDVCAGNNLRPQGAIAGFCVFGSPLTNDESAFLNTKLSTLEKKFPLLFSRIWAKGYHSILVRPAEIGETGGTVLGEAVPEKKLLVLYRDFFTAEKQNLVLQTLGYSVADIVIVHELMHALDGDNTLVRNNLSLLGWSTNAPSPADAFRIAEIPGIANTRITNSAVAKIKSELGPLLSQLGPWRIYVEARKRAQPYGYPTIYGILGGPIETFAELGAYIALDPTAPSYVPAPTINWFRSQILQ